MKAIINKKLNNLECSVILTTHNRPSLLKDSLISLANQNISKNNYEILVCDNYSHDKVKPLN